MRIIKLSKISLFLLLIFSLNSCCPGCAKCKIYSVFANFKVVNNANAKNLIFGPNRIYDTAQIKFFSKNNSDTTFYLKRYQFNPINDTILVPLLGSVFPDTLFVSLKAFDIDTILFNKTTYDNSPCCGITTILTPALFNTQPINKDSFGVYILKKIF